MTSSENVEEIVRLWIQATGLILATTGNSDALNVAMAKAREGAALMPAEMVIRLAEGMQNGSLARSIFEPAFIERAKGPPRPDSLDQEWANFTDRYPGH